MNDKTDAQKQQLKKATDFLDKVLATPHDEIQRAAAIQAFEFCFELSWKYLKSLLEEDGSMVASPKAVFREAAEHDLIDNPDEWFDFLRGGNLTVHTYIEAIAEQVYGLIKNRFVEALRKLIVIQAP